MTGKSMLDEEKDRVTTTQIAAKVGLSRFTVSKILNGDTSVKEKNRKKVLELCDKLGFVMNQNALGLKTGKNSILALIVPYITDGFYAELIEHMENYAGEKGYILTYKSSYNNAEIEKKVIRTFLSLNVCGMIVVPAVTNTDFSVHLFAEKNIPFIYLDRTVRENSYAVLNNNHESAFSMTEYLLGKRENVAFIDSFYGDLNPTAVDRKKGYLDAMKKHGRKPVLITAPDTKIHQDNEFYGLESMRAFLKGHEAPQAVFCITDAVAFGAEAALREIGLTPGKDVLVAGHDDLRFSQFANPSLTTMRQPAKELAENAVMFISELKDGKKPKKIIRSFSSSLIIRNSA